MARRPGHVRLCEAAGTGRFICTFIESIPLPLPSSHAVGMSGRNTTVASAFGYPDWGHVEMWIDE
jgi:hypothetical protein